MEVKKNKKNKQIFAQPFVRPHTAPAPRPTDPGVSPEAYVCSLQRSRACRVAPTTDPGVPSSSSFGGEHLFGGTPDTNICSRERLFVFDPKKRGEDQPHNFMGSILSPLNVSLMGLLSSTKIAFLLFFRFLLYPYFRYILFVKSGKFWSNHLFF